MENKISNKEKLQNLIDDRDYMLDNGFTPEYTNVGNAIAKLPSVDIAGITWYNNAYNMMIYGFSDTGKYLRQNVYEIRMFHDPRGDFILLHGVAGYKKNGKPLYHAVKAYVLFV